MGIVLDRTCSFVGNNGWRETMVGTISLYDKEGNRLHTIYSSQAPEFASGSIISSFYQQYTTSSIWRFQDGGFNLLGD